MYLTLEAVQEMKILDIRTLDREKLVDARDIVIDETKSATTKVRTFLEQVKNPFAQKVGEYVLVIGYSEQTDDTIDDKMIKLARKGAQINL